MSRPLRVLVSTVALALAVTASACSSCGDKAAGAEVARLIPAYSVGSLTLKNITEMTQDVGLQQLVAAGGVDAQRGLAAMTGMLGFDPSNPATIATAGLDPNAPGRGDDTHPVSADHRPGGRHELPDAEGAARRDPDRRSGAARLPPGHHGDR
jgi:hypothetical protein